MLMNKAPSWSWASVEGPIDYRIPVVSDQVCPLVSVLPSVKARDGDVFGQIIEASLLVTAKVFSLGLYSLLRHNVWVSASRKPNRGWVVFDGDIDGDADLYLLPTILCSQGAYCIIMERGGTWEGMPSYRRVGFARVSESRGGFGNSSWIVPDWFRYWVQTEDVQRFRLV